MKPLRWVGSTKSDFVEFPGAVQDAFGYALYLAQIGTKHTSAKVLKGFGDAGVLEIVSQYDGDAFRAVYTVRIADAIYVLHAFQKKSRSGIATPKADIDLIQKRLKTGLRDYQARRSLET